MLWLIMTAVIGFVLSRALWWAYVWRCVVLFTREHGEIESCRAGREARGDGAEVFVVTTADRVMWVGRREPGEKFIDQWCRIGELGRTPRKQQIALWWICNYSGLKWGGPIGG